MSRHTRMRIIEDRITQVESRLATAEQIIKIWFETLDDDERQALVETAREQHPDQT